VHPINKSAIYFGKNANSRFTPENSLFGVLYMGRRPAEIFFSAKFTLPDKSSPSLPSSSRASSKPVTLPAQVQSLTPSPSWLPQSAFWPLLSASALIRTYPDAQRAILAQTWEEIFQVMQTAV
jgi:hypothetical protein